MVEGKRKEAARKNSVNYGLSLCRKSVAPYLLPLRTVVRLCGKPLFTPGGNCYQATGFMLGRGDRKLPNFS